MTPCSLLVIKIPNNDDDITLFLIKFPKYNEYIKGFDGAKKNEIYT